MVSLGGFGGNSLGDATLGTKVDLTGLSKGLKQGEVATKSGTDKMGTGWKGLQGRIQGTAKEIPIVGNQLAGLVTPMGAATVGIGFLTTAIVGSIKKVADLEKELRPMLERSGLAAESLQVLRIAAERLGSEDGLEGVTDSVQELQLRLAEAVQDGTGPAVAAFDKLGLSSEDLINKSPEESFIAVITALQNMESEAGKKFLADELMGGSSEKLSGIINANSEAFAALTREIQNNADIVSGEALESAREMDASSGGV